MKSRNYIFLSLITFCSLYISLNLSAQQLPNSGFENWEYDALNQWKDGQRPVNWNTSNIKKTVSGITAGANMVFPDGNARSGTYCAKAINTDVGVTILGAEIKETSPAWVTLGSPWSFIKGTSTGSATAGTDGGIPFSFRPDTLSVWIKRSSSGNVNAHIVFYSWTGRSTGTSYKNKDGGCSETTHYDEESDIRRATDGNECGTSVVANQVGEGMWRSKSTYSNWTEIKVPITYYTNDKPEKCNVIISAANYPNFRDSKDVEKGATIWADDVKLIYSSAIHELYIRNIKYGTFKPNVYEYTYTLGLGATEIPDIIAKRSGRTLSGSEITIKEGEVDGDPTLITVKAEDGSSTTTYTIYFVSQQSNNSRVKDITYNGVSLPNFSEYTTNYNVSLPYGTTDVPEIEVVKAEDKQTYKIETSSSTLPCTTTVTVYAQDKSYTTTYTINFSVAQLSDNKLQNISINGNEIIGFNPTKSNYTIELPQGTTSVPEIIPISAYPEGEQTIVTTDNGLDGIYTIEVSAPGSSSSFTYKLSFVITASTNCYLQNLAVDGITLEGFDPEITSYNYELPQGTTELPEITYTSGDAYQTIVTTDNGVNGKYKIEVTSQSGRKKTYTINFSVFKSDISTLNDIKIGGISLENFKSDSIYYTYELQSGTTSLPEITYTKGEEHQTVVLAEGGVNGTTTIRVTAENGLNSTSYKIVFSVLKSNDANLINIKVDGIGLDGFRKDSLDYAYTLAADATSCPTIEVETEFPKQTVEIIAPLLEGTASIKVYSESGDAFNIYTIRFSFAQSDNNYLKNISINGISIADFVKNTTDYIVALSDDTKPTIAYEKDDSLQSVVLIENGTEGCSLVVTAENGTRNTYNVKFNIAPSGNALLKDIKIFDNATQTFVSLPDFASDKFAYTDTLDWRTNVVPNIHPVVGQKGQIVTISYGKINATTTLHVEAEDGTTQDYTIVFPVKKSSDTTLEYISLSEGEIDFHPDTFFYNVVLPYGTTQVPIIDFGKNVNEQIVTLVSKNLNDTTSIIVTAENGAQSTYKLTFDLANSGKENILSSIVVEGVGAFTDNAEFTLPYGTTVLPTITYVKNFPEQTVLIDNGGIHAPTTITVKANEDGVADKVYTLTPKIGLPHTALPEIKVNGAVISNYNPGKFTYVVNVNNPVGEQPIVEYTNSSDVLVEHVVENTKHVQLRVLDQNDPTYPTSTYNIYFYYPSDVIPNASFEEWSTATYNNASKPTGWIVPADVANSYTYKLLGITYGTYTTGEELARRDDVHTQGRYAAQLRTTYHRWSISGAMPGMMTLGNMEVNLTHSGNSTSSISGGIPYRNTPDTVLMDYRPEAKKNINNMRFLYTLSDGTNSVNKEYSGGYTNLGSWVTMRIPTYEASLVAPNTLNITINSAYSENAKDLGGTTEKTSTLYVDNLRFVHNSLLKSISIEGAITDAGTAKRAESMTCTNSSNMARADHINQTRYVNSVSATTASCNFTSSELQTSVTDAVYKDRRNETISVKRSETLSLSFSSPDGWTGDWMYGYAYIDWNNNGDFSDSGELVAQSTDGTTGVGTMPSITIPADAELGTYTLRYKHDWESTDPCGDANIASNAGIIVDFELQITAENSSSVASEYYLPADYQGIPSITTIGEVPDQEHTVQIAQTESTSGENRVRQVTITSKAEDGTSTNYTFSLIRPKSSNKLLNAIKINGELLEGFAPNTYSYNYSIPNGTLLTPDIEAICGSIHQNVSINVDGIKTATVVVTPENGDAPTTYSINFIEEKSNITTLKDITIEGNPADFTFDENTTEYNVVLAAEATLPMVSFTKNSEGQTVTITNGENTTLRVVAENGTAENLYTINFVRSAIETDAKLALIAIDNENLTAFSSDIFDYEVERGTDETIYLTYEKTFVGDSLSTTIFPDSVVWNIENKNSVENRYRLTFVDKISTNAYLNDILIEGTSLSGFKSDSLHYSIVSDSIPDISIEKGEESQMVEILTTETTIVIVVTAENGITNQIYTIDIVSSAPKSDNALLSGIEIGGETLTDFVATTFDYNYTLPMHTDVLPLITAILGHDKQSISITSQGVNNITTIVVLAEDGISSATYHIAFSVLPCNNASLSNIEIGGEALNTTATSFTSDKNFDSNIFEYNVVFPKNTIVFPDIKAISLHESCQVITTDTIIIDQSTCDIRFKVIAENKVDSTSYIIHFSKEKSDNALLEMIYFNDNEVDNFEENTLNYVVNLPYGTTEIPTITYQQQEVLQNVILYPATTLSEKTTIVVTAENGITQNVYSISFNVLPSEDATLSGIFIGGELLNTAATGFVSDENFDSNTFEYKVFLPVGTTELPDITWETSVSDITNATLDTIGGVKGVATITVIAQNGISMESYTIYFDVLKSNNNKLADLTVEGVTIGTKQNKPYEVYFGDSDFGNIASTFNPDSTVYTLVYPIGTDSTTLISRNDIDFTRSETLQTVVITQTRTTEFLITVTAENGEQKVYVILTKILLSNNSYLKDIKLNGISIEGFEPTKFDYEYLLYQGDTIPSILPIRQEKSQITSVLKMSVGEKTIITCQAEDLSISQYRILFKYSTENPGDDPTKEDVCWTALSDSRWKASSKRSNVYVYIFEPSGRMIDFGEVPVVNANNDICDKNTDGKIFRFAREGKIYIYCFVHKKKRLLSGKILY